MIDHPTVDSSADHFGFSRREPLGAIYNTTSRGRFDLVVYRDGLLAVRGTYANVALRAAGVAMIGAGVGAGAVAAGAARSAASLEARRLRAALGAGRDSLAHEGANFFIAREAIVGLSLQKRWHRHSLIVRTHEDDAGRRFDWKPALNRFESVRQVLTCALPDLVE